MNPSPHPQRPPAGAENPESPEDPASVRRPLDDGLEHTAILVVDDDPESLQALEAALGEYARYLVKAPSGDAAMGKLLACDYAVVLIQVKAPNMEGFETARMIRARPGTHHVPIIFVTGCGRDDSDMHLAYEIGAVDYLSRPLVPAILRAKVRVFLELRQRTEELRQQALQRQALERVEAERRQQEARRQWEVDSLHQQNQRLEEADRRKDQFIGVLAHELLNPLAPIVSSLELMRLARPTDETLIRAHAVMDRQVTHLLRLLDSLLDISRVSQGEVLLDYERTNLVAVVREAFDVSSARCRGARRVEFQEPPEPILVDIDPVRIVQAVSSVLDNALRFTGSEGRVWVSTFVEGDHACIRIRDDGRGIDPAMLPHVFEMFVQERDQGRGLGLGLSLVKQIVELHHGEVSVHSEGRGAGSDVLIRLPRATLEDSAVADAGAAAADTQVRMLTITLVEDDPDVRATMRSLLECWGHSVEVARSGPEGLDLVQSVRPDVALLDIDLPGLDGYAVARQICRRMGRNRPSLVAVSGYGQPHDRERARAAGFDAHLIKPARPRDLQRLLRTLA